MREGANINWRRIELASFGAAGALLALTAACLAGEPGAHSRIMYDCLYREAWAIVAAGMAQNPQWASDHTEDKGAIGVEIWGRCLHEHPDEARVVDRKAAEILAGLALTDGIERMMFGEKAAGVPELDVYVAIALYSDCVERNAVGYAVTTNEPAETVFKAAAASCPIELARLTEANTNHGKHMIADDITASPTFERDMIKSILDARLAARSGEGAPVRSDHAGSTEPRL
jgi:hypothetical protein